MNSLPFEPLDIVLLARPSCRTVAYCTVMNELGVYPREVIWLSGEMPFYEELLIEDKLNCYTGQYFDLTLNTLEWCRRAGSIIYSANTDNVNASEVIGLLQKCAAPVVIFSANGIVAPATLETNKRFIHVHPGILPNYRGSTCFYYAILEESEVGASAFFMDVGIDDGLILARSRFKLNIMVGPGQRLFMDHILDPYIRARVLSTILSKVCAGEVLHGQPNEVTGRPTCYVMHPLLRALAVKRLNWMYDPNQPTGISELKIP